ncbi:NACHT domain-containing protein [Pseudomonas aeruginosa]|uniref:NACHT domain-containing protein n=1 Tax=Pseudomonas aeruginosa TaxID=287 RepID=UPI002340F64D|nr:NACHT domain-containing protein [Pseudomonas aeruginosa]
MRRKVEFGSSIDPLTGKSDSAEYIAVEYTDESERKSFNIQAIAERLRRGEKIILLGDYGTGKSRCTREVFNYLVEGFSYSDNFVFAINLREHWGAVSAIEIIAGHLKRLGLSGSVDRAMQLLVSGKIVLILDGFDEVGSQTFGGTQDRRESIRKYALQGIRELITSSSAGVLVTGRPHYFNSNKEMFESLGVSSRPGSFELMKCHSEFSVDQARKYLANIGLVSDVPKWLPRKPLMFLILAQIERDEAEKILSNSSGEIGFWGSSLIPCVFVRPDSTSPSIHFLLEMF